MKKALEGKNDILADADLPSYPMTPLCETAIFFCLGYFVSYRLDGKMFEQFTENNICMHVDELTFACNYDGNFWDCIDVARSL